MDTKLILTDCDGVLLNWEQQFHNWMNARGYNKEFHTSYEMEHHYPGMSQDEAQRHLTEFNGSSWIIGLPPFRDATIGVAKLVQHGYKFHVITAMGTDKFAKILRQTNLDNVFGKDVIIELTMTDGSENKYNALLPYKDSDLYWIEDNSNNAVMGADLGLKSILMNHSHNMYESDKRLLHADNWNDICNHII